MAKPITAKEIEKKMKEPGRHGCGQGLYLEVDRKGRCSWVFIYTRAGRRREMGLGSATGASAVTLAQARDKRDAARGLLAQGIDPLDARREAEQSKSAPVEDAPAGTEPVGPKAPTFGAWCDSYLETMRPGWRNAKHAAQWAMTLGRARDKTGNLTGEGYCLELADKRLDEIDTEDVLAVLRPIWSVKPETASRICSRLRMVLDAAKVAGHRDGPNPATWHGHLKLLLPKRQKLSRGHHPAMPYASLPGFWKQLQAAPGLGAKALAFAILCASRSGEVRGATWAEISLPDRRWTIPGDRMKAGKPHEVPLTDAAIKVLQDVALLRPEHDDGSALVFPGADGKRLSDMTLAAAMKRLKADAYTPHGFRSSFRDWAGDCTEFPREVAEHCLAHTLQGVEAAYRRSDAFSKRKALLTAWADYLDGEPQQARGSGSLGKLRRRRVPLRRRPATVSVAA